MFGSDVATPSPEPALKVHLLGAPRIVLGDRAIHLDRQKAIALLAYLVVTKRTHSREWLSTLLWPDAPSSRAQLRNALTDLRHKLGDDWLDATWDEVGIRDGMVWSDVGELTRVSQASGRGSARVPTDAEALIALYPQHLFSGFSLRDAPEFDEWQRVEEQNIRARYEGLLDVATSELIGRGQLSPALRLVQHWVTINPFNEHARRQLIRLYAWTNQRGLALREYQQLRTDIWEDHRSEPEPETVELYQQLQSGDLPRVLSAQPSSRLPPVSRLVGRNGELDTLAQLVQSGARLVTITGPGGIGKTHLATVAAHNLEAQFTDGCLLVQMDGPISHQDVLAALVKMLGVRISPGQNVVEVTFRTMQGKRMLLVLDSLHHLERAREFVLTLLQRSPGIVVLATAHDAIQLATEHVFPLKGLSWSSDSDVSPSDDAVTLFVVGAQRVAPRFAAPPAELAAIRRICALVDGMPLGILLASAWTAVLTPGEIADEIAQNFDFLQVNHPDLAPRHRSLRAVFETAWALLSPEEQVALMNLSVFQDSFTRKAAEEVCGVSLLMLKSLTTKALISYRSSRQRYVLHDVSRKYAGERLVQAGHAHEVHLRYQRYYADYLIARETALKGHLKETAWTELEGEMPHIRAVWMAALAEGNFELALEMIDPLHLFLRSRGWEQGTILFDEGRRIAARVGAPAPFQAKLLMRFYPSSVGLTRWKQDLEYALALAEGVGDRREGAHLHGEFGWYGLMAGDLSGAREHFALADASYRSEEDYFYMAEIQRGNAYLEVALGNHAGALHHTRESLRLRRQIGDHEGEYETLILFAEMALITGDLGLAEQSYASAHQYFAANYPEDMAHIRSHSMAWWFLFTNQLPRAHEFADRLLATILVSGGELIFCTAHAVKLMAYLLTGEMEMARLHLSHVEALLAELVHWPSTTQMDVRFFINLSRLLAYTQLERRHDAADLLRELRARGQLGHAVYFTWLTPVLLRAVPPEQVPELHRALLAYHSGGFLVRAAWATRWLGEDQPTQQQTSIANMGQAEVGTLTGDIICFFDQ